MGFFSDLLGKAKKGISNAWGTAKQIGKDAWGAGKEAFGSGNLLSGGLSGLAQRGRSALSAGWDSAKGGISKATGGAFDDALNGIQSAGSGILDKIQGKISDFGNSKNGSMVNSIMQAVGGMTGG
jgi:hypothetical protein